MNKLKVWLDDCRPMPKNEGYDVHVKTAKDAIALVEANRVAYLSFDHDLGYDIVTGMTDCNAGTGYDVAKVVERLAAEGKIEPFEWFVHSMNPTGADNIVAAMRKAEEFWGVAK